MIDLRTRFPYALVALLALVPAGERAAAQVTPATIPTVVAQAAVWPRLMTGPSQFFAARLPDGFPAGLVPRGARVVGGSITGDSSMFLMRTAVFEVRDDSAGEMLLAVLRRAGFAEVQPGAPSRGGFIPTTTRGPDTMCCGDSTLAMFGPVDPARAPGIHSLTLIGGEAGRQSCGLQRTRTDRSGAPVDVPTLTPPAGAAQVGGSGSSWHGDGGSIGTTLHATMPVDTVLAHYTAQLVAAGWRTEGRPVVAEGIGVQRFAFRDRDHDWTAGLFVLTAGDRQQIRLEFARPD